MDLTLRILDSYEDLTAVEELQRLVWPGSETDVVPLHMLITVAHNGGLVVGAYTTDEAGTPLARAFEDPHPTEAGKLVGFVYGFPGLYFTPDGPRPKHCSHQLAVHPNYRNLGLGFKLKRAQWQMVRRQNIDLITWTYDPLLSPNAFLNIARLGAVCTTYLKDLYGPMRDGLNLGLPSDRFQVDWWVNSKRVARRLSKRARIPLDLAHALSAEAEILNPVKWDDNRHPVPPAAYSIPGSSTGEREPLALVEIPPDFMALKAEAPELAAQWRLHSRNLFEGLFQAGYIITDFIHESSIPSRSFYVISHGESTL